MKLEYKKKRLWYRIFSILLVIVFVSESIDFQQFLPKSITAEIITYVSDEKGRVQTITD